MTVFAAGCFNRVHEAHKHLLREARALGDELVVVISHDSHNKKPNAVSADARKKALEATGLADRILVGKPDSFAASLRQVKPKILVLGYDQRLPDEATAKAVEELGIRMIVMPWFPGKEPSCGRLPPAP